jgi:ribosomal protein S18 acetylase RimI-like enzyme
MADDLGLDNPVYAALTGAQSQFARVCGQAVRYQAGVAPFLGLPPDPSESAWVDAVQLVAPGTYVAVQRPRVQAPGNWSVVREFEVLQMVEDHVEGVDDPEALALGPADVPEMLGLVRETDPGPFLERTIELGRYVGIRRGGHLVAMAGERIHLEGWREISAVCTASAHRGHGLASRLVRALAYGIHHRDERAFLSVVATNTNAVALYERLGFSVRISRTLSVMTPTTSPPGSGMHD